MQNAKFKIEDMKPYYLAFIFIALTLCATKDMDAQTMIPKRSYMHLTGQIGRKYVLTMNLVKINDSIYADWQTRPLSANDQQNASLTLKDGNMQVICGKMKNDGSCTLAAPFSKAMPILTGQLSKDQKLTGTWEDEDGKFPFELRETYSGGSLPFNVSYLKGSVPLVKKPGSPKGSIDIAILTPVESTNAVLSDSLKKIILEKFMKRPVRSLNPDLNLNTLKEAYYDKYISANEALYNNKSGGPSLEWESLEFMHILYNDKHFLTFYIISYAFTGGAHGLETEDFYVADLKKGEILRLNDIFIDGYEREMTAMITQKFSDMNSLKAGQKLTGAGFFTDEVKPTDNFYLTGDGIGFFYNHYEIAPYASSPNTCFLTFDKLKTLIRQEGILQPLLK